MKQEEEGGSWAVVVSGAGGCSYLAIVVAMLPISRLPADEAARAISVAELDRKWQNWQ
jgi:hypothetical protein